MGNEAIAEVVRDEKCWQAAGHGAEQREQRRRKSGALGETRPLPQTDATQKLYYLL